MNKDLEIMPYRSDPLDIYVADLKKERGRAVLDYLRKKIELISFREQYHDFEEEILNAGLNPNDKATLERIIEKLNGNEKLSGPEIGLFSQNENLFDLYEETYQKLIGFKDKMVRIFEAYRNKTLALEARMIKSGASFDFIPVKPFNILESEAKLIFSLGYLSTNQLSIRQSGPKLGHTYINSECLVGVFDFLIKERIFSNDPKIKIMVCSHISILGYQALETGIKKYLRFYLNKSQTDKKKFGRMQMYLEDYLKIPEILEQKLGLNPYEAVR